MAVHNGQPYLMEAVDSILGQSFRDFEFVIVDDASTDGSRDLLAKSLDERVRLLTNKKQQGLAKSLNIGLAEAKGEYIARMDHDDISLPHRLQRQVAFLDEHAEIDILGCWARTIGRQPPQTWRYPIQDEEIRSEFMFSSPLVHSSVMWRRETFEQRQLRYDETTARAQDFELWTRAAEWVKFANLGSVLLHYRVHADQVGNRYTAEQQSVADRIRRQQLDRLGIKVSQSELILHNRISRWEISFDRAELSKLESWFLKLRAGNKQSNALPQNSFEAVLERRWWAACRAHVGLGLASWVIYNRSPLVIGANRSFFQLLQFWAKAVLRQLGWRAK